MFVWMRTDWCSCWYDPRPLAKSLGEVTYDQQEEKHLVSKKVRKKF